MARTVPSPLVVGGRIPTRAPQSQLGGTNPAARYNPATNTGSGRTIPRPILLQPGPALSLEQSGDRQLNQIQQSQRQSTAQARGNPFANGTLLEGLALVTGSNTIQHQLGIPVRGMILGALYGPGSIAFALGPSPATTCVLTLSGAMSGKVTADVWLYG